MSETPAVAIKGSWEDVLSQARQLATSYNDDAIPLYEKVVTRIGKMPDERRMAANQRLQILWQNGAVELQMYLTMRRRYDESLALLSELEKAAVNEEQRRSFQMHEENLLIQAERADEALERCLARARADGSLLNWTGVVVLSTRLGAGDQASDALIEIEKLVDVDWNASVATIREEKAGDQAFVASLHSLIALEAKEWDEGVAWFERAMKYDSNYKERINQPYGYLVRNGRYADALKLIRRDLAYPIRSGFWHGLALHRMGEVEDAKRQWQKVTSMDLSNVAGPHLLELILSFYYLDDPEGVGLGAVLRILQEEEKTMWSLFYLAGVGWALRDNLRNARANFETAMLQCRARAEGDKLPNDTWTFLIDLVDGEMQEQTAEYFATSP